MKAALRQPASFTLVEILAATAILSILFAIMFGILQQTSVGWQAANRKVEASQAARLALEQISKDLENCLVVIRTNVPVPGTNTLMNYAFGFAHLDASQKANVASSSWTSSGAPPVDPNDSIFVVTQMPASGSTGTGDLCEIGYVPIFIAAPGGFGNTPEGRYVLCRSLPLTNGVPVNDFLTNSANWELTPGVWEGGQRLSNFFPIVDHCLRFEVRFVYTNAFGTVVTDASTWGRPTTNGTWVGSPGGAQGLPLAADITLSVLDERSAERLFRIQGRTVLLAGTLQMIPTNLAAVSPVAVRRTLEEGLTTFSRRVYFKNR